MRLQEDTKDFPLGWSLVIETRLSGRSGLRVQSRACARHRPPHGEFLPVNRVDCSRSEGGRDHASVCRATIRSFVSALWTARHESLARNDFCVTRIAQALTQSLRRHFGNHAMQ